MRHQQSPGGKRDEQSATLARGESDVNDADDRGHRQDTAGGKEVNGTTREDPGRMNVTSRASQAGQ